MNEDLVLTPGGWRPRDRVRHIPPTTVLDGTNSHLRLLQPSGEVLADLGVLEKRRDQHPLMPDEVYVPDDKKAALGSGWITYAYWSNTTGTAVSHFSTTWTVPPAPATQNGQTIFLFNGIQNAIPMILQPVLQWGPSAAGGGNYWAIASWFADGQNGAANYSTLVQVNPGDSLTGLMTLTNQTTQGFSYRCEFVGFANTILNIQNTLELAWNVETLEAYSIATCSDYPDTTKTAMVAIGIQTGSTAPALAWTAVNAVTDCGQQTSIVSDSATSGEVDLFYRTSFQTALWMFPSDGTAPTETWNSGPGNWDWTRTAWLVGDFAGDGKAQIAAMYNYGSS